MYLARIQHQKEGPVEFDFLTENDAKQKRQGRAETVRAFDGHPQFVAL